MTNNKPLPEGWKWEQLSEICQVILGQSPSSESYNIEGHGLPFFQGKAEFGNLYPTVMKWCTSPNKIAEQGDILISVRAPVGPTNLCQETSCIGRGLAALRPKNGMPSSYLLHYLRFIETEWDKKATGTTFKAITGNVLKSQLIPIPPIKVQHAIVEKIETLFSQLDAGVAALKRTQAALKRYRASVLKAAFEGKLVPQDPTDEPAEEQLHHFVKNPIRVKSPSPLPYGWCWATIGDLTEHVQYGYTESSSDEPVGPKFLRITDIQNRQVNWDSVPYCKINDEDIEKYLLMPGDIVFARTGATTGKSYLIQENQRAVFASYLIRLRLPKIFNEKYLSLFLDSPSYWLQIINSRKGSTQPGVNAKILASLQIPISPLAEQQRIVAEVEQKLSVVEKLEHANTANLLRAARLRQAILKSAFEGKF